MLPRRCQGSEIARVCEQAANTAPVHHTTPPENSQQRLVRAKTRRCSLWEAWSKFMTIHEPQGTEQPWGAGQVRRVLGEWEWVEVIRRT